MGLHHATGAVGRSVRGRTQDGRIRTTVDGVVVQNGCVDQMIFSVPRLIAIISTFMTLAPGDVILTGTPAGAGHNRLPPQYLCAGQTVEVTIDGIGSITNTVTASHLTVA